MRVRMLFLCLALGVLWAPSVRADVLALSNGGEVEGSIEELTFDVDGSDEIVARANVLFLQASGSSGGATDTAALAAKKKAVERTIQKLNRKWEATVKKISRQGGRKRARVNTVYSKIKKSPGKGEDVSERAMITAYKAAVR